MPQYLIVYKASAGSGKTFRLAVEYIKLLMKNPTQGSRILAVTFTNKATEEMKIRILSQLYGIWKQLPDSSDYVNAICKDLDMSEAQVSQAARVALFHLLHHYHYFRVETIDSFFQKVLRNLARELELTANLRVDLNDTQVEEEAVDQMIDKLEAPSPVLKSLMKYIHESIDDDKNWNVISQVKRFGRHIFSDEYKDEQVRLHEIFTTPGYIDAFEKTMHGLRAKAREELQQPAREFFDICRQYSLTDGSFSYKKSGIYNYFVKLNNDVFSDEKLLTSRVAECMSDAAKWTNKSAPDHDLVYQLASDRFIELLNHSESARPRLYRTYKSASIVLRHLNQLRLLGDIEHEVRMLNREANRFLLSDTQHMLNQLIDKDDSPFIFEKIGSQLDHIMIDEFQDTSSIQWRNFKVLMNECLSHGTESLIVGDVKQSIYRWRSGDWRLLNDIETQFNPLLVHVEPLKMNYRSARNIINFNNAFFQKAIEMEVKAQMAASDDEGAAMLSKAYRDVFQFTPENQHDSGMVRVRFFAPDASYEDNTFRSISDTIDQLLSEGVRQSNIAILLRTNRYIPLIAQYLSESELNVRVVSDEAFLLKSSVGVNLLVNALRLLHQPDNVIVMASLAKSYQRHILHSEIDDNHFFVGNRDLRAYLPPSFVEEFDTLLFLPLYDLVERLYKLFGVEEMTAEGEYMCAFFDAVSSHVSERGTDVVDFLTQWEGKYAHTAIQSDGMDGIRILSIHKSKGLEFDHVIIPFCDWQLEKNDVKWFSTKQMPEPFCQMPLIPVDFNASNLTGTIFETAYRKEHLQNVVDNMNLLYVAFTRARKNLYIICKDETANGYRSKIIRESLEALPTLLPDAVFTVGETPEDGCLFEYGELSLTEKKKRKTDNIFLQSTEKRFVSVVSYSSTATFWQSNASQQFFQEGPEDADLSDSGEDVEDANKEYIQTGTLLHALLSRIKTLHDVNPVLREFEFEGLLGQHHCADTLRRLIRSRLTRNPQARDWFSDSWTVRNECSILYVDDEGNVVTRRPDRVISDGRRTIVIDFKFARPDGEHVEQVRNYMQRLVDMGNTQVEGFLWYVYTNKIERVHI